MQGLLVFFMFPSCLGLLEICQWGFIDVVVADKDRIDHGDDNINARVG